MTKKYCRKCGSALTKAGAKFCTTCGATVDGAETDDKTSQETADLPSKQTAQTVAATDVLPASKPPSNYNTEEIPQVGITAQAEERSTEVIEVIAPTTVTQSQKKQTESALETQPSVQQPGRQSGGRKKLALAAALGVVAVVALVAASFFFVNSRRAPEAQAGTQHAGQAEPSGSAQPAAQQLNQQANQQPDQQSSAGANNQAQQQTRPQPIGEVKSPAIHNADAASNQQRQAAAKPTPETPQEQQAAGGPPNAEQSLNQGKTFLTQRRYQEALAEFARVKNLEPANKDVYYLIGSAYHGMNQLEQALEAYRQCTSGNYASVSRDAVKKLEKKVGKVSGR